ncbi:hypothetical protein [Ideonella sp. BN130291]|uniref:hypothetical protein n=1 Tax=Ideonella sp. BN130291 TaxID=3112940 RepID=UPI002E25FC66|nr:hypothetical protein [Ideonella sp. BN130291]
MKKIPLAASLVAMVFSCGAALAQSTGSTGSGSADTSAGSSNSSTSSSSADSLPSGSTSRTDSSGSMGSTSASGTSGALGSEPTSGHRRSPSSHSAPLQRANAGGGLPAGELSTPWQDAGGEAGSLMR